MPLICSLHAPWMLQRCSNDAPRMLHRCSASHSRFLVKQQILFSTVVKSPILHPSSKNHILSTPPHPPFFSRECDEYPLLPIFTLISKRKLLNRPHDTNSTL